MKLDEWCDDCAEYDKENHCCPRFNRVIHETLDDVRKEAYKHGKSKGIKKGMAMQRTTAKWEKVSADQYIQSAVFVYRCTHCQGHHFGKTPFCPWCGAQITEDPQNV